MIREISLRKILNSKQEETVEAVIEVLVNDKKGQGVASCAAGTSAGKYEAVHAPQDVGTLIEKAQKNVIPKLIDVKEQEELDRKLHELDGTKNFANIGGCVSLSISMAFAKAMANASGLELYEYINKNQYALPKHLGKCLGGGAHAKWQGPKMQEFLTVPLDAASFEEAVKINKELHAVTGKIGEASKVDFEGGWILEADNEKALDVLSKTVEEVGHKVGIGVDVAASEFFKDGKYNIGEKNLDEGEHLEYIINLIETYDLYFVEDAFNEDDFASHAELTEKVEGRCLVCGDDLLVTNTARLSKGLDLKACNSIIIKPNQAGTLTDTYKTINLAKENNVKIVPSHRSGETKDTTIAHLAVAFSAPLIKTAIAKSEEYTVKLNELIRIEKKISQGN
jgi:enolase